MSISSRAKKINPSPTLGITAKAKKMQSEGINVISFGAGEPDFDTLEFIKNAAKNALDKGFTKYTPTSGIIELKKTICEKFMKDNNIEYSPDEILVSCGAKHSIFNAIMTLCDDEDEVILPSPYWVSYPEMINFAGGKPIIINTTEQNCFKITPEQLKNAITPKTKLFILNSPSNPTGMVYTESELREIAKVIMEHNIYCISDEIYEKLVYENIKHMSIASFDEKIKNLTIVVNGVSKSHSMTGWRIGYAAGPKEIIQAMSNLQDHSTSNPTSIAQCAAVEALKGPQQELENMVSEFKKRRDFMVDTVNSINGISTIKPDGAFYCWINVSKIIGKSFDGKTIKDSLVLADLLLTEAKVAVVPGIVFGDDNFVRLSYATSIENIVEGLNRIKFFVEKIL